uniref:Uncharacterized protein n=1 Tax=Arundo donax TaxID=35708 RepID=A0A0A9HYG0_ARUDO
MCCELERLMSRSAKFNNSSSCADLDNTCHLRKSPSSTA